MFNVFMNWSVYSVLQLAERMITLRFFKFLGNPIYRVRSQKTRSIEAVCHLLNQRMVDGATTCCLSFCAEDTGEQGNDRMFDRLGGHLQL